MNYREIEKLLKDNGWKEVRQKGSHKQFHHPLKKGTVTISYHGSNKDIHPKTLKTILRQAGL